MKTIQKKPEWLKIKFQNPSNISFVNKLLQKNNLYTVCQEAKCPNQMECFANRTATFMIMGDICTRNCKYCNVSTGMPKPLDNKEPEKVASSVKDLGLKHVVITSVTRDDLDDGGAFHFAKVVEAIKLINPNSTIEVLIPDFKTNFNSIDTVIRSHPDVINHNIEATRNIFDYVRPQGNYQKSLDLLKYIKKSNNHIYTKSGFMVGLGESHDDVVNTLLDLYNTGCDFVTIGQYLQPSLKHIEVKEYITPEKFKEYESISYEIGFKYVASGPFVRSSYNAAKALLK